MEDELKAGKVFGHAKLQVIDSKSGKIVQEEEADNAIAPWAMQALQYDSLMGIVGGSSMGRKLFYRLYLGNSNGKSDYATTYKLPKEVCYCDPARENDVNIGSLIPEKQRKYYEYKEGKVVVTFTFDIPESYGNGNEIDCVYWTCYYPFEQNFTCVKKDGGSNIYIPTRGISITYDRMHNDVEYLASGLAWVVTRWINKDTGDVSFKCYDYSGNKTFDTVEDCKVDTVYKNSQNVKGIYYNLKFGHFVLKRVEDSVSTHPYIFINLHKGEWYNCRNNNGASYVLNENEYISSGGTGSSYVINKNVYFPESGTVATQVLVQKTQEELLALLKGVNNDIRAVYAPSSSNNYFNAYIYGDEIRYRVRGVNYNNYEMDFYFNKDFNYIENYSGDQFFYASSWNYTTNTQYLTDSETKLNIRAGVRPAYAISSFLKLPNTIIKTAEQRIRVEYSFSMAGNNLYDMILQNELNIHNGGGYTV